MQSPRRSNASPPATSQDFDLGLLKRQLLARQEEQILLERAHEREKNVLEANAQETQLSLSSANAVLSLKNDEYESSNREVAKLQAQRNRQLAAQTDKLNSLELQAQARREEHIAAQGAVRDLQDTLQDLRMALAKQQLQVEASRQKQTTSNHDLAQVEHQCSKSKERHVAQEAAQRSRKEALERRIADLGRDSAAITESSRRFANNASVSEGAHQERVSKTKINCENVRNEVSELQSHISQLRKQLTESEKSAEDARRRRQKAEEEALAEHVASRKADLQKLRSSRDEQVRLLRNETAKQRDALASQLDAQSQALAVAREEESALFEEEMRLQAQINATQDGLIGMDVLEQRVANARHNQSVYNEKLAVLDEGCDSKEASLKELRERQNNLTDTVAPLPDVERSIATLNHRAEHTRSNMADAEADHAIWRVQQSESEQQVLQATHKTERDIEEAKLLAKDLEVRNEEQLSSMQSELRVIQTELEALDAKVLEMQSRNSVLDGTLEHVTRQRRQMQEEANARRDAARAAAASLLAQLE